MKYRTIVIDPPWNIGKINMKNYLGFANKETLPYNQMTDDEIRKFPINDYAEENCQLFLWTTHTTLPFGLELCKLWGFKYHCLITWDKTKGVVLLGVNRRTENCIYAYKGRMELKQKNFSIPTIIKEDSTNHSEKPKTFYNLLLRGTPEPRIDIFSRKKHIGFDSYGNEAEEPLTLTQFT